jgi:F-type H+-transporting ATPase subunit a
MFHNFASTGIEIHVGAGTLFTIGGFAVTNSMLTGAVAMVVMLGVFAYVIRKIQRNQYNRFVGLVQWAFEGMLSQVYDVIPDRKVANKVAPLALSIFFIMLFGYWMSILPGLDSIIYNGVPVIRALNADLNFTLAVAIIVMLVVQYIAIITHGPIGNIKRYIRNPLKDPIGSFEGLLELVGEFSRYAALSVRMFGNAFAGEILLVIIVVLTGYFSVIALPPFLAFELFIGFIQAYVFFILTVIFTSLAIESHGAHEEHSITSHDHSPSDARTKHAAVSSE